MLIISSRWYGTGVRSIGFPIMDGYLNNTASVINLSNTEAGDLGDLVGISYKDFTKYDDLTVDWFYLVKLISG